MFTVIIGIIAFIFLIYLVVTALRVLIYLIPLAIILSVSYWIIKTWGWIPFLYVVAVLIILGTINKYIELKSFNQASLKVKKYFLKYEMAEYTDLKQILKANEESKLDEILQTFVSDGQVECVYLNQETLYKWIGPGTFSKGIIRKEIKLD